MQCPSCEFNNIPGSRACARCRSRLDLSSVDVLPPRAGDHAIPLSMRRVGWRVRAAIENELAENTERFHRLLGSHITATTLARGIIPGWGQRAQGQRTLGWIATGVWAILVLAAVYLRGGPGGWPAYFMLVGFHGFTLSLLMTRMLRDLSFVPRVLVGLASWVLLNALIYIPAGWVMSRLVVPIPTHALADGRGIRSGEVVMRQGPWLREVPYQRGDVVAYSTEYARGRAVYGTEGLLIDRIIAVPGDAIRTGPTEILVNGVALKRQDELPLREVRFPKAEFIVGENEYLIIPSMGRYYINGRDAQGAPQVLANMSNMMRVPATSVVGKVVFRTRPYRRFGPLDWNEPTLAEERATAEASVLSGPPPTVPGLPEAVTGAQP